MCVEQAALPFVNDMEDTLEEKGADRVGSRFLRGPRGGTPRFLNVLWLTSGQYFLMWRFLNALT